MQFDQVADARPSSLHIRKLDSGVNSSDSVQRTGSRQKPSLYPFLNTADTLDPIQVFLFHSRV